MAKSKKADIRFMPREQLLELAKKFKPISVDENDDSGSILEQFCIGAVNAIRKYSQAKVHSNASDSARNAIKKYVRDTPQFTEILRFVGNGSSRITFALQDGTALKFAYNAAGVEQNKKEATMMQMGSEGEDHLPCFPVVYEHTEDWRGMLVQCCSPIDDEDFTRLYGFENGFNDFAMAVDFLVREKKDLFVGNKLKLKDGVTNKAVGDKMRRYLYTKNEKPFNDFMDNLLVSNQRKWRSFRALLGILLTHADENMIADLGAIENWGMVIDKENGEVTPVVVDMGFDDDVFIRFYTDI